jgi:hypothetical protein
VIYQTFSHREIQIALLDAHAGSPPNAPELLIRHAHGQSPKELISYLRGWEQWCAELLESHLSHPELGYYRSLHENQSWLTALKTVLNTGALILAGIEEISPTQAEFVFAIARHAAIDLVQAFLPQAGTGATQMFPHRFRALAPRPGCAWDCFARWRGNRSTFSGAPQDV